MLYHDRLSMGSTNSSGIHVAFKIFANKLFIQIIFCSFSFSTFTHLEIIRRNRNQVIHFITTIDIQNLTNRT